MCANYQYKLSYYQNWTIHVLYFIHFLYQLKCLQQVQNVCAGFVSGCYGQEEDCLKLGWLPIIDRSKLHLLKATF